MVVTSPAPSSPTIARRRRVRADASCSALTRLLVKKRCSSSVSDMPECEAHASATSRRPPAYKKLGSDPALSQSVVADREPPARQQVIASVVDPGPQSRPVVEQRLVRHLDGGRAARRIAVEGEQAVTAELRQQDIELVTSETLLFELSTANAATGVVVVLAHVDQTEEHPARLVAERARRARRRSPRPAGRGPR